VTAFAYLTSCSFNFFKAGRVGVALGQCHNTFHILPLLVLSQPSLSCFCQARHSYVAYELTCVGPLSAVGCLATPIALRTLIPLATDITDNFARNPHAILLLPSLLTFWSLFTQRSMILLISVLKMISTLPLDCLRLRRRRVQCGYYHLTRYEKLSQ